MNFTTSPKDCKCSGSFPHIGSKKIDLSVQDSQPQHHHLAIYTVAGPYSSTSYAFAMLLQKPQPISIRQSTPVTSTTLYSPGRCVSSTSSPVLVNEPWNQTRTASLRRTETRSSDHSSVDSPTRTSWDSGFSDGASSNTSINELSAGLDKNIAQRIEAEVDRISMEIAQSNHLHDGLQSQQAASPAANEADYALPVPHVQDVSLALTDPSVLGDPIFMSTAGFEVGPAGLRIGHCSYLNLPAGDDCTLRIIGPDCAGSRPRFQLIISTTILDMRTTDKSWKLSSIHDVTEIINEMATDRLSYDLNIQSTSTRGNGQDVAPKHLKKMKSWDEPFDWNKFTEDESATHDQQPEGPSSPDSLNTPDDITSFIQSANLLKSQTKKFFILTPRQLEHRKRNIIEVFRRKKSIWAVEIASLVVSFVSNDLLHEPHVVDRLSNHLRRCTADSVTKCFGGSEGFEWRATLRAGTETVINCFPIDNDRDGMAREVWWVCFVET